MSAQGLVQAVFVVRGTLCAASCFLRAPLLALVALTAGCSAPADYVPISERAPDGAHVAEVRLVRCGDGWCESLWAGQTPASATLLETLADPSQRATEIAWAQDSRRVAFLINGSQLRLFDARTNAPAGQLDLVPAAGQSAARIARGVTFSDNGAAITFDDCPRERSGCRPGLVAVQ